MDETPVESTELKTKICSACQALKEPDHFSRDREASDGLKRICRGCSRAKAKEYYARHRVKLQLIGRRNYWDRQVRALEADRKNQQVAAAARVPNQLSLEEIS